ncbi:MAG: hypothetical protein ABIZ91_00695 [Gemmatimonadaceae bacterium]
MRPLVLLSLSAFLAVPVVAPSAQQTTTQPIMTSLPLVPGARVRVTTNTLVTPLQANYLEMRADTAVFIEDAAGRGLWTFTLDQITKLEQSAGLKRYNGGYIMKSALIGAPIGALLFWGTTGIIKPSDPANQFNRTTTAVTGLAVGALVGAIVGTRFTQEHWSELPLRNRVSVMPGRRGGVHVGVGFSY